MKTIKLACLAVIVLGGYLAGCVHTGGGAVIEGTAYQEPLGPEVRAARGRAVELAAIGARDQIFEQILDMPGKQGRPLREQVVSDARLRARLREAVRGAQRTERRFDEQGGVTVTMELSLEAVNACLD